MNIILYLCASSKCISLSNFSQLGLSAELLKVLPELGIETPTAIQNKAIPVLLGSDRDFIGLAQTGTGKTAAFGLPLLDVLDTEWDAIQAVILAPTRELAQQIANGLKDFSRYKKGLRIECVYGGAPIANQIKALKRQTHVVVATPGRLIDLAKRKALRLDSINYVILDEADEMMNMGFKEELNQILAFTPTSKTTWLFSATMPPAIRRISSDYMNNPYEVAIKSKSDINENISHQYVLVKSTDKTDAIVRIIDAEQDFFGIIFCKTKVDTERLAQDLMKQNCMAEALNGDLTQRQRDVVMNRFKKRDIQVLVATDVAARGIDVDNVTHVLHHRLPDETEFYTHRSGRTARAGKKGISLTLATKGDMKKINLLEEKLKIEFEKKLIPTPTSIVSTKIVDWAHSLANLQVSERLESDLLNQVHGTLSGMSKDELIDKLISVELSKIKSSGNQKDLNVYDQKSVANQKGHQTPSDMHRYYINIGTMDGASAKDIKELICDVVRLKDEHLGKITLKTKSSFFEVNSKFSKAVTQKFNGLLVNNREIRVNRDEDSPQMTKKRRSPRKKSRR